MEFQTADPLLIQYAMEQATKEAIQKAIDSVKEKPHVPPQVWKEKTYQPPLGWCYNAPKKQEQYFFVYTPAGVSIIRVPQSQLGSGVLGVAYPGRGLIKIADHLFGLDFEEVKKHEINHILYPSLTEYEIRQMTKRDFPFETRFH